MRTRMVLIVAVVVALLVVGWYYMGRNRPSALFDAVFRRDQELVSELLKKGASPNEKVASALILHEDRGKEVIEDIPVKGWTPLHMAAYQRHEGIAKLLLSAGGDVNAKNSDGQTPIMVVFKTQFGYGGLLSHKEMVGLLIAAGANLNLPDNRGDTVLDYAIRTGWEDMVTMLREAGAKSGR